MQRGDWFNAWCSLELIKLDAWMWQAEWGETSGLLLAIVALSLHVYLYLCLYKYIHASMHMSQDHFSTLSWSSGSVNLVNISPSASSLQFTSIVDVHMPSHAEVEAWCATLNCPSCSLEECTWELMIEPCTTLSGPCYSLEECLWQLKLSLAMPCVVQLWGTLDSLSSEIAALSCVILGYHVGGIAWWMESLQRRSNIFWQLMHISMANSCAWGSCHAEKGLLVPLFATKICRTSRLASWIWYEYNRNWS